MTGFQVELLPHTSTEHAKLARKTRETLCKCVFSSDRRPEALIKTEKNFTSYISKFYFWEYTEYTETHFFSLNKVFSISGEINNAAWCWTTRDTVPLD